MEEQQTFKFKQGKLMDDFYVNSSNMVTPFKLDDSFIAKYAERNPPMDIIGLVTYYRTYARIIESEGRNEHWFETLRRVVEGIYNIQKDHCLDHNLTWKETKAQRSAQIMYDKMYDFRIYPPGRGLWMMGTNYVKTKGATGR